MSVKPMFRWFTAAELSAAAGGDPWEIADQLRAGDAGAIDGLATAFHQAGARVRDADDEFTAAKRKFEESYDRNNGSEHPINDGVEVQKVTAALAGHPEQLSRIAAELQQTAASLASAQRDSATEIEELNAALHSIDDEISSYGPQIPLVLEQLLAEARAQTSMSLGIVANVQGAYIDQLHTAETAMMDSGYVPDALDGADAVAGNSASEAAEIYKNSGQLSEDQAMVAKAKALHPYGQLGWSHDEVAAERRLDDYTTITDPMNKQTSPVWYENDQEKDESQFLAGERLGDFNVANSVGPVAKDPVLGGDMRDRAKARLLMQRQLQDAQLPWSRLPMNADDATKLMDQTEVQDRAFALTRLQEQLRDCGVSPEGAAAISEGISRGVIPSEYLDSAGAVSKVFDGGKDGAEAFSRALPRGSHWEPGAAFSDADAEIFKKLARRFGHVGNALDLGSGIYEWLAEGKSPVEIVTKSVGGLTGAWALGGPSAMLGGTVAGPPGAFIGGLAGATAGAFGGEAAAEWLYQSVAGTDGTR